MMFVLFVSSQSRINNHPNISFLCLRAPGQPSVDGAGLTPPGHSVSSLLASDWSDLGHAGLWLAQREKSALARGSGAGHCQARSLLKLAKRILVPYSLIPIQDIIAHKQWIRKREETTHSSLFPLDFREKLLAPVCVFLCRLRLSL